VDPLDTYRRRLTIKEIISGIAIVIVIIILLYLLWRILNAYIDPANSNPTQKKDLVQAFALIVGGLVAFGTLLIGWRNLRHNQRTLLISQQNTQDTLTTAQEVENRRAQNDALQSYFEQIGKLLLEKDLRNSPEASEVRILAQAQTHTVLPTLNAERKRSVLIFLYKSNLLDADKPSVGLIGADLSTANLRYTHLPRANLQEANLQRADLRGVDLQGANLLGANLYKADLTSALNLSPQQIKWTIGSNKETLLPGDLNPPTLWHETIDKQVQIVDKLPAELWRRS
jgi:hypothetical protein